MKQQIIGAVTLIIIVAIIGSIVYFWPHATPEEIQAKAELKRAEAEASAIMYQVKAEERLKAEQEAQQRYLEREAAKTPEQKANESETSIGEAVVGTAGILGTVWVIGKLLEQ